MLLCSLVFASLRATVFSRLSFFESPSHCCYSLRSLRSKQRQVSTHSSSSTCRWSNLVTTFLTLLCSLSSVFPLVTRISRRFAPQDTPNSCKTESRLKRRFRNVVPHGLRPWLALLRRRASRAWNWCDFTLVRLENKETNSD